MKQQSIKPILLAILESAPVYMVQLHQGRTHTIINHIDAVLTYYKGEPEETWKLVGVEGHSYVQFMLRDVKAWHKLSNSEVAITLK